LTWEQCKNEFKIWEHHSNTIKILEKKAFHMMFSVKRLNLIELFYYSTLDTKVKIIKLIFNLAKVSNHLLLITYLTSKTFINKDFLGNLEKNNGVIDELEAEKFLNDLDSYQNSIDTYEKLVKLIDLESLYKENDPLHILIKNVMRSNDQQYSRVYIPKNILNEYLGEK